MTYNTKVVLAYFKECGLPTPETEFVFAPPRKWRFDFAFVNWEIVNAQFTRPLPGSVAVEVEGGVFVHGAHNRGSRMLKTWERDNEAAALGWRIIRVQPKDLCTQDTIDLIKRCLS